MNSIEQRRLYQSNVLNWVEKNHDLIISEFERERIRKIKSRLEKGQCIDDLSTSKRSFSEMPICKTILMLSKPSGFGIAFEKVYSLSSVYGAEYKVPHFYYYNAYGNIVCLTAGQFVPLPDGVHSGDRIKALQSRNKHLITTFPNGLSLLYGHRDLIKYHLGLVYP